MLQQVLTRTFSTALVESQEGGVPDVGKAGKEVPVCAWHLHSGREGVLVHRVAPEQDEAEQVSGDCVHFLPIIMWILVAN